MTLDDLKRKILRERGLDCEQFKGSFFLRRMEGRMRQVEAPTVAEYARRLDRDPGEYAKLFDSLSINVTQFFRDAPVFHAIRSGLLPALLSAKAASGSRTLRVWSAGCASGQEAYSLAVLVAEALGPRRRGMVTRVYATDVDPRALAYARHGIYTPAEMDGVAGSFALPWFTQANGGYTVVPEVRELVRFKRHDLNTTPPFRHVDLLLCRNVLIYFSRDAQRRVIQQFHAALRPGGYLVLGQTEMLRAEARQRLVAVDMRARIYQKPREAALADRRP